MDFGLGDAEYKRHFGDESWVEDDVLIFARRRRPVTVNLARSGVLTASRAGKAGLAKSGNLDAVRRRWRRPARRQDGVTCGGACGSLLFALGVLGPLALLAVGLSAVLDRPAKVVTMSTTVRAPSRRSGRPSRTSAPTRTGIPVVTHAEGEAREGTELDLDVVLPGHDPESLDAKVARRPAPPEDPLAGAAPGSGHSRLGVRVRPRARERRPSPRRPAAADRRAPRPLRGRRRRAGGPPRSRPRRWPTAWRGPKSSNRNDASSAAASWVESDDKDAGSPIAALLRGDRGRRSVPPSGVAAAQGFILVRVL